MARAVLGEDACVLLIEGNRMLDEAAIRKLASGNYRAFGISANHANDAIPILVRSLLEKHGRS
jgi:hypothetical protein